MSTYLDVVDSFESYNLQMHGVRLPEFHIPEEELAKLNLKKGECSNYDFLRKLCLNGFKNLNLKKDSAEYKEYVDRVKRELETMNDLGFVDYILLVWLVMNFCEKKGIPVGFGRGCLSPQSKVFTDKGFKFIKDVSIGDIVVDSNGEEKPVVNTLEYNCEEELINFKTSCNSFDSEDVAFTKDHKILAIKAPFPSYKKEKNKDGKTLTYVSSLKNLNISDYLNEKSLSWIEANKLEINDYLVRYVGRTKPIQDIEFIDLKEFIGISDKYDDNFVYEKHFLNETHPLSIRTISAKTNICRSTLKKIKKVNNFTPKNKLALIEFENYLRDNKYSLEDFKNFESFIYRKHRRFLEVNQDFCYFIGFYIGDGWLNTSRVGLAFHSEDNINEINKLSNYFSNLNFMVYPAKHNKKKLVQLYINSNIIVKMINSMAMGKTADKIIPEKFLNIPDFKLESLLKGLLDSDGSTNNKTKICYDSINPKLIFQVRWIMEYFGYRCYIIKRKFKEHEKFSTSYKVCGAHPSCQLRQTSSFNNGKYLFVKIKDKKTISNSSKKVYDLTVKDNPSYHTDGFIVHNSAAGSLILNLISVTKIDPVKYGLFFERFISKTRAKKKIVDGITYLDGSLMCDVDMDICYYRRHEVLEFLDATFKGKTAKILTFNSLSGKLLIKECGKVAGNKTETEMIHVASLIPKVFGKVKDIHEAYEAVPEFKTWCDDNREIYDIALKLRDLIKNKGVHPSGILLSYGELQDSCPVELSSDKNIVSGFDMEWVSLINVKLDCLGLRGVSVVDDICKAIGIKATEIDLNNSEMYQPLQDLKSPHGLFQIEADTAFNAVKKIKPKNLEELSGVLAIARPGAMQFLDEYALFTNTGTASSIHPFFDDVFNLTGQNCLYQEQILSAAKKIGFSGEEAEQLRRCLGKKKTEEIKLWKQKIIDKVSENKLDPAISDILWKIAEDSANYSFCKSHSIAYASLSALTVYLKFKYPHQFFLSLLKMTKHEPDPRAEITKIGQELNHFGIKMLSPDIIKSSMDFTLEDNNIRFGLHFIKGISDKSLSKLDIFRNTKVYPNKFALFQAASEAGLSISVLAALIQAGALEAHRDKRSYTVLEAQLWNILKDHERENACLFGEEFNYNLVSILKHLTVKLNEKGKPFIKESRLKTIKKDYEPFKKMYELNSKNEEFASWYYEQKLMGYSCNIKLIDVFADKYKFLKRIEEVIAMPTNTQVRFVGRVLEQTVGVSKAKGTRFIKLSVSDETGTMNVLAFNDTIDEIKSINGDKLPNENNVVYVSGKKMNDAVFAQMIYTEDNKIYIKFGDLTKDKDLIEKDEKAGV